MYGGVEYWCICSDNYASPQMDSIEPMQVDEEGAPSHSSEFSVENPNFDLEAYSNAYAGLTRVRRLTFISKHCTSLRIDALK